MTRSTMITYASIPPTHPIADDRDVPDDVDGIGEHGADGERNIETIDSETTTEPDALALFLRGQIIGGKLRRLWGGNAPRAVESLVAKARAFMLVGQSFESAMMNELLIRRYEHIAEEAAQVMWAHFNAGCAFMRVGIVARACEHFTVVAKVRAVDDAPDAWIVNLAIEGMRQSNILLDRILATRPVPKRLSFCSTTR